MDFAPSEEQALLRDAVRRFLTAHASIGEVRRASEKAAGFDRPLWERMRHELALHAVGIPEEDGGAGGSIVELAIVAEELGRALSCVPWFASCLASRALLAVGAHELLARVAAGELATLAWSEGRLDSLDGIEARATEQYGRWAVSGTKPRVLSGNDADIVLVVARAGDGLGLFLAEGDFTRTALPTVDPTRPLSRLEFVGTGARALGRPGQDGPALARALDEAAIALSAELLGTAERAFELTLDYVKTREQFGRPIGSFQAVKHQCADVLVGVETTRSTLLWAAWTASQGEDVATAGAVAKATASEAAFHATGQAIQLHGGIGFTWDHDAHLHFKRARASAAMLGDAAVHRARVAHTIFGT